MFNIFKNFKSKVEPRVYTKAEKEAALRYAVDLWLKSEYQKATEICKKYGISTKDSSQAFASASLRQTPQITTDEQKQAVRLALKYWNEGQYSKAMDICKKYKISDQTFSHALVAFMRQR